MDKIYTQNLGSITRKINKNIITSFLLILIFFVVVVSIVFVGYKNNEKKIISQKLNATFLIFTSKISQQLVSITMSPDFRDYIHAGWITRSNHYDSLLAHILNLNLDVIAGVDIISNRKETNIFHYGIKTDDSVTLDICYFRRFLNFDIGNCSHKWKLYFKNSVMAEELKKLNPELVNCDNCGNGVVSGKYFGGFPMSQFSGMKVNLNIKTSPLIILWEIVFLMIGLLSILVAWNINRIKSIFKKNLFDPIIEITSRIKENKSLPLVAVEELSYLTKQIDMWKKQVIALEEIKALEEVKKSNIMQSIGASIAHELRTPIRSMISGLSGIEKFLPILIEGYDLAKKARLVTKTIKPQQADLLRKVLSNLKKEGVSANVIIDMLLMKIKGTIAEASGVEKLSISECLDEALQRYNFQEYEKNLVTFDITNNFELKGDKILIIHILFNLLKNALYYIASARSGKIYIHFESGENENMLYFRDTGKGISKEVLPHIFDRFYSKTEGGAGIGLSFCKMAMEWMSGDISCQSTEGEYTEFVLHFPIYKE